MEKTVRVPEEAAMNHPSATQAPCLVDEFAPTSEIAVPLMAHDRHDPAVTLAQELAERWGLSVHLVHVRLPDDPVDSDRLETLRAAVRARHPGTEVSSTLVAGENVPEAVAPVIPSGALIVMSSEHADRAGTASIAEGILRATGGPAMVIGPNADYEDIAKPVIIALDGSPTAEDALGCAVAFAESMGQQLQLVQVVAPSTSAHVAQLRAEGQRVSESGYLQSVAERLSKAGHTVGWEVVHETDVVHGLLSAANHMGSGVVVLGTHGDSGLARRMLGSTAMGLVAASKSPVLVVETGGRDEIEIT